MYAAGCARILVRLKKMLFIHTCGSAAPPGSASLCALGISYSRAQNRGYLGLETVGAEFFGVPKSKTGGPGCLFGVGV